MKLEVLGIPMKHHLEGLFCLLKQANNFRGNKEIKSPNLDLKGEVGCSSEDDINQIGT